MASVKINEIKWDSIEYTVDKFEICIDNDITTLQNAMIKNLYLEKDFDNLMMPIFIVGIAIPEHLYYKIHNNHKNTTFRISMSSRKRTEDGSKSTKKSSYLSDVFNILGIDGKPFTNEKEYTTVKNKLEDENGHTMQELANDHTFILGKKTTIESLKKIQNVVFSSATMTDATNYLLSSSGITKVLMSPMDNTTSYKELILLPIPLNQQLQYLNKMFGFYSEGSQIFFDFDMLYILRNSSACTAYQQNEVTNINLVVYKKGNGKEPEVGSTIITVNKDNIGYINIGSGDNLKISNSLESTNSSIGSNSLVLNATGSKTDVQGQADGSYNVITTTTHNKYYASELKSKMMGLESVVTIDLVGVDLKLLEPNKTYTILSDDSSVAEKLKYNLKLSKLTVVFGKEGDAFVPVINTVFMR